MKLISARASRAPAPSRTENRAPDIRVARSKSMMPSAGPSSQCGLGAKSNAGGVPQVLISWLSADDLPAGTLSCGRFGSVSRPASRRCSTSASSASSARIFPARALFSAKIALGSSPAFFARATASPAAF